MKKLAVILSLTLAGFSATAQSGYDAVLQQIETNSATLSALRKQTEVQQLGNRTGIYLANPEVEFNYLWGNPAAIGNRTDINIKQSFDFPTAYAYRGKIAGLQNENAELLYKAERLNLLLAAKRICIDLIYHNALAEEYAARLQNALRMAEAYQYKLNAGETNVLENNKAQLNLAALKTESARIETERAALLAELKTLNGGRKIDFSDNVYPPHTLPADFETWYAQAEAQTPMLQYVSGQIEIERQQVKLNRALGLPKFSAGYMSEKVVGEHFQGITAGISLPLWENKNRVKQTKAAVEASQSALEDAKNQFCNRLQTLYQKAVALQQNALTAMQSLTAYGNEPLLKKALDAGEISLLNYLLEIEFYYDAMNRALEIECDFELTVAELQAVEL